MLDLLLDGSIAAGEKAFRPGVAVECALQRDGSGTPV